MKQPIVKYRVDFTESERGWGPKPMGYEYFDSKEEAADFVKGYNAKNNEPDVPEWYSYATMTGWEEVKEEK